MKKFLVSCVLLLSFTLIQAQSKSIDFDKDVKTEITQADLPIGEAFVIVFMDFSTPAVAGVVNRKLIKQLPLGVPFVLSVNGVVTKYNLRNKPKG